jgi:uncharacterized repeat protein (TIGR03803 family)
MTAVLAALMAGLAGCAFVQPIPAAEAAKFREKILHSFGGSPDGGQPYDSVIDVKGTLYGTTFVGGKSDNGTVFTINVKAGAENVLHSFDGDPDAFPEGNLIDVKGMLYGTTSGQYNSEGTVFTLDPNTRAEKTLYTFCSQANCVDGAYPVAGLIIVKGKLFGTTFGGGASGIAACNDTGCGTVFSLDLNTGAETVLYSFCSLAYCADGRWPTANLIDVKGILYGTAGNGGVAGCHENFGCGTVFSIDPNTRMEKTSYSFCSRLNCTDGGNPQGSLIDMNGFLYGTTQEGGTHGEGTVFVYDPGTGAETVLYSFCRQQNCADGATPLASLIDVKGTLYGTTFSGGTYGYGTVFSLDPDTRTETVRHSFGYRSDGEGVKGGLIDVMGTLFGTTEDGGSTGYYGTVFELKDTR